MKLNEAEVYSTRTAVEASTPPAETALPGWDPDPDNLICDYDPSNGRTRFSSGAETTISIWSLPEEIAISAGFRTVRTQRYQ